MKTLQFNLNSDGFLVLSDLANGKLYFPSDSNGNFLNFETKDFKSILFVSDGRDQWAIDFISEQGLGWIANAINAAATIGTSIVGSRSAKKSNVSAESQLQTQLQIQHLALQVRERESALQNPARPGDLSTTQKVVLGVAAAAIVGTVAFLVLRPEENEDSKTEKKLKS